MKSEVKLYNIFFPVWLILLFYPLAWLLVLPVNFIVDFLTLWIALCIIKANNRKEKIFKSIWKVWIFGFIADILGGIVMLASQLVEPLLENLGADRTATWWYENITNAVSFNAFESIFAFFWVLASIIISGILIYVFNNHFCLKKAVSDPSERRKLALALAVFTAPYTFFIPTPMLG